MKKIFIIAIFCLQATVLLNAQNVDERFIFDTYAQSMNIENVKDYPSHELGDVVARKWQIIENTFLVRYETKVGLTSSNVEVRKHNLLESIEKLDKYYRKATKKGLLDKAYAAQKLSAYQDLAYTLFYEESEKFEKALSKAKNAEDIMNLYDSIQLADYKETANK